MSTLRGLLQHAWKRIDKFLSVDTCPSPIVLGQFRKAQDLEAWKTFTDSTFGGRSTALLQLADAGKSAVFSGRYSKLINEGAYLVRSGYAGFNKVLKRNANLALHDCLDMRVRGDGNTYIVSLRLDQISGGDEEAWQAPLPTTSDNKWQDVRMDFDDFIFTFRGRLVRNQPKLKSLPRVNLLAVGITLSASPEMPPEGDFRLEVERIAATAYDLRGADAARKAFRGVYQFEDEYVEDPEVYKPSDGRVHVLGHVPGAHSSASESCSLSTTEDGQEKGSRSQSSLDSLESSRMDPAISTSPSETPSSSSSWSKGGLAGIHPNPDTQVPKTGS